MIGAEFKSIVMPFLFAICDYSSFKHNKMAAHGRQGNEVFETSLRNVLPTFGSTELKDEQKQTLFYLASGHDVFVNLPTGFGKSLIHQLA